MVLLDAAIMMNPNTWVASGHVGSFSDPLMECKDCHTRHRADKLIEEYYDISNPREWYEKEFKELHNNYKSELRELAKKEDTKLGITGMTKGLEEKLKDPR